MKKPLKQKSVLAFGILAIVSIYAAAMATTTFIHSPKVGYVNSNALLEKYAGFQSAREQLRKETEEGKRNIKTLETEINDLGQEIINKGSEWDAESRKQKQDTINRKQEEYARYSRAASERAAKLEKELTQPIFNELNSQITRFGKENGYDVIFGTTAGGNILYAKDSVDLTERFLAYVNQRR